MSVSMEARSSHGCPYSDHQNRSLSAVPSQESDVHLANTMLSSTNLAFLLDFSKIQRTEVCVYNSTRKTRDEVQLQALLRTKCAERSSALGSGSELEARPPRDHTF